MNAIVWLTNENMLCGFVQLYNKFPGRSAHGQRIVGASYDSYTNSCCVDSEPYTEETFDWQLGLAIGLWWISQLWINNHIWRPKSERLAKAER